MSIHVLQCQLKLARLQPCLDFGLPGAFPRPEHALHRDQHDDCGEQSKQATNNKAAPSVAQKIVLVSADHHPQGMTTHHSGRNQPQVTPVRCDRFKCRFASASMTPSGGHRQYLVQAS